MSETESPHRTLGAITKQVDGLKAIPKAALRFGDQILVQDLNSTYSIQNPSNTFSFIRYAFLSKEGISFVQKDIQEY